jgi:hypothetical protein
LLAHRNDSYGWKPGICAGISVVGSSLLPSNADPQAIGISGRLARRRTAWIFIENDSIEEMDCRNVS